MNNQFFLEIITPERTFFTGDVDMLIYPTNDGERGIMKNHIAMATPVKPGILKIQKDGKWLYAAISEGFIEVLKDRVIAILDTAEWPDEIDANRAKEAKIRAEERMAAHKSKLDYIRSQAALTRAFARLKVKKKIK